MLNRPFISYSKSQAHLPIPRVVDFTDKDVRAEFVGGVEVMGADTDTATVGYEITQGVVVPS